MWVVLSVPDLLKIPHVAGHQGSVGIGHPWLGFLFVHFRPVQHVGLKAPARFRAVELAEDAGNILAGEEEPRMLSWRRNTVETILGKTSGLMLLIDHRGCRATGNFSIQNLLNRGPWTRGMRQILAFLAGWTESHSRQQKNAKERNFLHAK